MAKNNTLVRRNPEFPRTGKGTSRIYGFAELAEADLVIDAVYEGGGMA